MEDKTYLPVWAWSVNECAPAYKRNAHSCNSKPKRGANNVLYWIVGISFKLHFDSLTYFFVKYIFVNRKKLTWFCHLLQIKCRYSFFFSKLYQNKTITTIQFFFEITVDNSQKNLGVHLNYLTDFFLYL